MTLPNFLIIGAGKSGTTSLYAYLKQHPDIFMSPIKETNFFSYEGQNTAFDGHREWPVTTLAAYRALFRHAKGEHAIGEASPRYLRWPRTPERIQRQIPDARLIAILRNPAERAYSSYCAHVRDGTTTCSFSEIAEKEISTLNSNIKSFTELRVIWPGFYYRHLTQYFHCFDRGQVAVYLYDDLKAAPLELVADIFRFLGVDDAFTPNVSVAHNAGGVPGYRMLHYLLRPRGITSELRSWLPPAIGEHWAAFTNRLKQRNMTQPASTLDPDLRRWLAEYYKQDILQLQGLIGRNLSHWLN